MLFSLGLGTGKTPEPEVGRPEVVMVMVRNVAQDRNRILRLGKCHDRLPTTETGSRTTDNVSSDDVSNLAVNRPFYPTGTHPRPMMTSIDCHRRWGAERSDSTFACQKDSRFWRRMSRYARRSAVQYAMAEAAVANLTAVWSAAAARLARLDARSSRRTDRLAFRHSSSNHGSEGWRRHGPLRYQPVEDGTNLRVVQTC